MTDIRSDFYLKLVLGTAIFVVVSLYFYFFSYLSGTYSPYYGDEYFYFKNSESFELHSSLKAAFSYTGGGSKLLGADAHGPAYPLLYGLISKVIGWHNLNILLINIGIFLFSLTVLLSSEKKYGITQIQQVLLVLGSPISLFYSFTFLPELIHLAGGILIFVVCRNYLASLSNRDFGMLLGLILFFGCIRNTWFFALFGLIILPGPLTGYKKSVYILFGILLPFLFQHYLHEQVPNTFSQLGDYLRENRFVEASEIVFYNIKRNVYFAFTYSEGWFYTLQKLWFTCTIAVALCYFRKNKLVQFGLLFLGVLILFTMVMYKNYAWVELRFLTPGVLLLNLSMLPQKAYPKVTSLLLSLNFVSFLLIFPFLDTLMKFRINQDIKTIPQEIKAEIRDFKGPKLIHLDTLVLQEYDLSQFPVTTEKRELIRYILPYYEQKLADPSHSIQVEEGQLRVYPKNKRSQ